MQGTLQRLNTKEAGATDKREPQLFVYIVDIWLIFDNIFIQYDEYFYFTENRKGNLLFQ